jgi:hypothetical protein
MISAQTIINKYWEVGLGKNHMSLKQFYEKFEDTTGIIRGRKSKDILYNGQ